MVKTSKFRIHSLDTVLVENWYVRCSITNGNILVVMFNPKISESNNPHSIGTHVRYFSNERDANLFVNNICYHIS